MLFATRCLQRFLKISAYIKQLGSYLLPWKQNLIFDQVIRVMTGGFGMHLLLRERESEWTNKFQMTPFFSHWSTQEQHGVTRFSFTAWVCRRRAIHHSSSPLILSITARRKGKKQVERKRKPTIGDEIFSYGSTVSSTHGASFSNSRSWCSIRQPKVSGPTRNYAGPVQALFNDVIVDLQSTVINQTTTLNYLQKRWPSSPIEYKPHCNRINCVEQTLSRTSRPIIVFSCFTLIGTIATWRTYFLSLRSLGSLGSIRSFSWPAWKVKLLKVEHMTKIRCHDRRTPSGQHGI